MEAIYRFLRHNTPWPRPNTALEPLPLRGNKIVAIVRAGNDPSAFLIYRGGMAQRQAVGRQP